MCLVSDSGERVVSKLLVRIRAELFPDVSPDLFVVDQYSYDLDGDTLDFNISARLLDRDERVAARIQFEQGQNLEPEPDILA